MGRIAALQSDLNAFPKGHIGNFQDFKAASSIPVKEQWILSLDYTTLLAKAQ